MHDAMYVHEFASIEIAWYNIVQSSNNASRRMMISNTYPFLLLFQVTFCITKQNREMEGWRNAEGKDGDESKGGREKRGREKERKVFKYVFPL